jgi:hypothetical protein
MGIIKGVWNNIKPTDPGAVSTPRVEVPQTPTQNDNFTPSSQSPGAVAPGQRESFKFGASIPVTDKNKQATEEADVTTTKAPASPQPQAPVSPSKTAAEARQTAGLDEDSQGNINDSSLPGSYKKEDAPKTPQAPREMVPMINPVGISGPAAAATKLALQSMHRDSACGNAGATGDGGDKAAPPQGGVPGRTETDTAAQSQMMNYDYMQAQQIYIQMISDRQKMFAQMFQVLRDCQTEMMKIFSESAQRVSQTVDKMSEAWIKVIQG